MHHAMTNRWRSVSTSLVLSVWCAESFEDAYQLLMAPINEITEANKDCGWTFLPDLPTVAEASSTFETQIELKQDQCGNKALLMGGFVQCHAADEHIYHEMLIHPAMATFAAFNSHAPRNIFLGGSGEGAGARELLRWQSVESITMVDIDMTVTNFTAEWLPSLANGSFEDPRLKLTTADAIQYLEDLPEGTTFDVLILDFPDPFEADELKALYTQQVYELCKTRMHNGSVLVTQSGPCSDMTPSGDEAVCGVVEKLTLKNFAAVFPYVDVLLHPMATWKAEENMLSEWSSLTFGWVGDGQRSGGKNVDFLPSSPMAQVSLAADEWLATELGLSKLHYYSGARHRAAWEKPTRLHKKLLTKLDRARRRTRNRKSDSEL